MRASLGLATAAGALLLVAADRDPLAGRVAGAPVKCINMGLTTRGADIVDADTILYRDGPRIWKTGPVDRCPGLRPLATLIVRQQGGQQCRNDLFQTLDAGDIIPSGPCRFREFTPYTKP